MWHVPYWASGARAGQAVLYCDLIAYVWRGTHSASVLLQPLPGARATPVTNDAPLRRGLVRPNLHRRYALPERTESIRNGVEGVELAPKLSDHNLISGVVDAGDWIA
jgi:hypothetical protein